MAIVRIDEDGRVVKIDYTTDIARDGTFYAGEVPDPPSVSAGEATVLRYDRALGKLYWEVVGVSTPYAPAEPPPVAPTHEEIKAARASAYRATVDPITCEIARLRDMGGTEEEIAEAEERREAAVAAIKAQFPYPQTKANQENA